MNRRTKQFWIPALLNLAGTMVIMMLLQKWTLILQAPWKHSGVPVLPYVVWALALPLMGGATAAACARAGAGTIQRLGAVLSPALLILVIWFLILGLGAQRPIHWFAFFFGLTFWAGVPAIGLAAGAWMFYSSQDPHKHQSSKLRQRRFWMPAVVSLCLSLGILALSSILGRTSYVLAHGWSNEVVYLPWVLLSPFCGGLGAHLSRRAGGSVGTRFAAGLFPTIALLGLGITLTSGGVITFAAPQTLWLCRGLVAGILIPSAALAIGILPFLGELGAGTPKISASGLE